MIVTSKRCFLNKFIQRNTAEVVLNANYYVGDKEGVGKSNMNPNMTRNEYGEIEVDTFTVSRADSIGSMYHIRYNRILNPEPYCAEYVMGKRDGDNKPPEELFINHLKQIDTMNTTYKFLFGHELEGNGLQLLMFEDDDNIKRFGHIICQYLSMTFGVDIIFLDPVWRPDCNGYRTYQGNKEYGAQVCSMLNDFDMVDRFNQAVSESSFHHSMSNIREHLGSYTDINSLMHLYNTLFPDAPLPPGNYSIDQLREILMYNASPKIGLDTSALSNLLIQHDWSSILDRMSREADDYGVDDTGLF